MKRSPGRTAAGLLTAAVLAACSAATGGPDPATARPGAPGAAESPPPGEPTPRQGERRYTDADVRFMQGMIAHHQQALRMTDLVPTRSGRDGIRLLAQRIAVSQADEIALMRRWLESRGEAVPAGDAHHQHHGAAGHHPLMPGMLTAQEMARLAAASGAEFDRLFLEYMIRHHEGALVMVRELFATPGAGQEPEAFNFAAEVDADQRMEIERMRRLLSTLR